VPAGSTFCEACGRRITDAPAAPAATPATTPAAADVSAEAAPIDAGSSAVTAARRAAGAADPADATPGARACLQCGGTVGADGWCQTCGAKAPSERDHYRAQPAPWVAAVSDRGIAHHRNEDAMAVLASPDPATPDRRAVLVVLDGVSRTDDSSVASLAGAKAALAALATPLPRGMGTAESREAVATHTLTEAARAADEQVVASVTPGTAKPASATFTVALLEGDTVWHANIGDSRCYWLPDGGPGVQLTVDDSAAQIQVLAGVPRAEAEASPQAHAITGWLGPDSPSTTPTVGSLQVTGPGWLVACSDGLWNYASAPDDLAAQVRAQVTAAGSDDPAAVALGLVGFANGCGGQDNITVALARLPGPPPSPPGPPEKPSDQIGAADG
jgi:serine/threonine protein phosphatase PrpC